jgi:hypothetical protein
MCVISTQERKAGELCIRGLDTIAVVIVDVVHVQPITIEVERAANSVDHFA